MTRREPIGLVTLPHGRKTYHAECLTCAWSTNKRDLDDAHSLIRSHHRIAHPPTWPVYLEDKTR